MQLQCSSVDSCSHHGLCEVGSVGDSVWKRPEHRLDRLKKRWKAAKGDWEVDSGMASAFSMLEFGQLEGKDGVGCGKLG